MNSEKLTQTHCKQSFKKRKKVLELSCCVFELTTKTPIFTAMNSKVIAVIPSRYDSSRFPGKPLAIIQGKSMIQRVYEQAKSCKDLDDVIVATDDQRIYSHVESFGGKVAMTSNTHESGTDRCGEVLNKYKDEVAIVVNIQGDEPFIQAEQISNLINAFKDESVDISTLAKKIETDSQLHDPNLVKVVKQTNSFALYFSRSPIPYYRSSEKTNWCESHDYFKHVGIYAYRATSLQKLVQLPASKLEKSESLEQLRWLENGYKIHVGNTLHESIGIDTPEDLAAVNNKL
jgi:3-deoxy-manno-octulosonate cytidylyltransferase (CMP-KDO synthetase)